MSAIRPDTKLLHQIKDAISDSVAVIAAEQVTLLDIDLPVRGQRARRAALAFAVEDRIGHPLDAVHVALCRDGSAPGKVLAAVVDRGVMEAFRSQHAGAAIVPETLAIPAPEEAHTGAAWAVWSDGARAVVRVSDGTGFGLQARYLPGFWRMAGEPAVTIYGAALPEGMHGAQQANLPSPDARDVSVDLRQGEFAPASNDWRPAIRRVAAVLALGFMGHLGLAGADLWALSRIAETERSRAEAAIQPVLPGAVLPDEPGSILARLAPKPAESAAQSAFLPMISNVSDVLLNQPTTLTWRRVAFADETGSLSLLIEAQSLDALQVAEVALERAGYRIESGAATASDGGAEAEFRVSGGNQ